MIGSKINVKLPSTPPTEGWSVVCYEVHYKRNEDSFWDKFPCIDWSVVIEFTETQGPFYNYHVEQIRQWWSDEAYVSARECTDEE